MAAAFGHWLQLPEAAQPAGKSGANAKGPTESAHCSNGVPAFGRRREGIPAITAAASVVSSSYSSPL